MTMVTEYDWESDTFTHNGVHSAADEAIDTLYAWMPPQAPAPAPLPEAAFSLTLKGTLDGQEALLTARGQTAAEFTANLQAIRGLLDARPQPATPPTPPGEGWCAIHQVAMQLNHGKDGRTWRSHRLPEGGFCKGR